jgi:hypothetical protein
MSIWACSPPATYCQPAAAAGFIYCRSQEWILHSPSPAGFIYLEFSWTHAPFVFSSIQPYPHVAIAVLFYLEFTWGGALPPLSGAQGALPSFQLLVYYTVFFFSFFPGQGQSVQGAMLICPREYRVLLICSPGGLLSRLGASVWQRGSPPGISI